MATQPPISPSINADVTNGTVPLVVTFTGFEPATYDISYIQWDFGDNTYEYATWTPVHIYNSPDTYDVTLYIENNISYAYATETSYITVTDGGPLPEAEFNASATSVECLDVISFIDESTNYPTTWNWNFGDDETSTLQDPIHYYTQPGTYTVALTAANWNGSDTETKVDYITVTTAEHAPYPAFSVSTTLYATLPVEITFTDESTNGPTSWQWNFGDGWVSTDQNPTHTYIISGLYTITLIVTNEHGSATLTKTNYIIVGDYDSNFTKLKVKRGATATWNSKTTPHYLDGGELGYDKTTKQLRIGPSETESTAFASCDLISGGDYTAGTGIVIDNYEISIEPELPVTSVVFDEPFNASPIITRDSNIAHYGVQINYGAYNSYAGLRCSALYNTEGDNFLDDYVWYQEALESEASIPRYVPGYNLIQDSDFPTTTILWTTQYDGDTISNVSSSIIEGVGNYGENVRHIEFTHTQDLTPYAPNGYAQHVVPFDDPSPYIMYTDENLIFVRITAAELFDGLVFEVKGLPYGMGSEDCFIDVSEWTLNEWYGINVTGVYPYDLYNIEYAVYALNVPAGNTTGTYAFEIASPEFLSPSNRAWIPLASVQGKTYVAANGINIVNDAISVDSLKFASLPTNWESSKFLRSLSTEGLFEFTSTTSDIANFTDLEDVPSSYSDNALKFVQVNAFATGLDFVTGTPSYSAGYGIDLTNDEISVDTLVVATTGIILPGVEVGYDGSVNIQLDDPTPRRTDYGTISIVTEPWIAEIFLIDDPNTRTSISGSGVVCKYYDPDFPEYDNIYQSTGYYGPELLDLVNYYDVEREIKERLRATPSGITLTDTEETYEFYNEKNLNLNWFASLPTPWEPYRYLKSTFDEGVLEWATAGGTGGGIEDVPDDGNYYVRKYEEWVELGTLTFSTNDNNVTLPESPTVGDQYEMVGTGTAWTVHANTGQYIRLDTVESISGGTATNSSGFGCVTFIYIGEISGHNTWLIKSAAGTINIQEA